MLPFALGSITIRQDQPGMLPDSVTVAVEVCCSVCGAVSKGVAPPWDKERLTYLAHQLSKHHCPTNGHGAYEI